MKRQSTRLAIALAGAAFAASLGVARVDAHKPVTSPYDYNTNVFPLLRDHCGRCHVANGAAPMSLMTYKDAVPWAESIRDELTAGRMPPWPVDSRSPAVKGAHPLTPKELDEIVVWASGGTPHAWTGDPNRPLPDVKVQSAWKLGPPDLALPMTVAHTIAPGTLDEVSDVTLAVGNDTTKWVRAADLLPGAANVVRDAIISLDHGPTLAVWQPGLDPLSAPQGAAFELPPHASIHLQTHYKKHYDQEQATIVDKSTVGLYFTDAPASSKGIASLAIDAASGAQAGAGQSLEASLDAPARLVALTPFLDRPYGALDVEVVTPDGAHVPLLKLRGPRPPWFYRFWLDHPVDVPAGSVVHVKADPLPDYEDDFKSTKRFSFRVQLNYVPR